MDKICSSLRCCGCSLKGQVIFVGVLGLAYDLLFYLDTLVRSIKHIHGEGTGHLLYPFSVIEVLLFESYIGLNIIFWIYLLYGTIKETPRKSVFLLAWLLFNSVYIQVSFIDLYNLYIVYRISSKTFLLEELCISGITLIEICVVYRYYRTIPKQNNVYSLN